MTIPTSWLIAQDYDPNKHLMQIKGKAYLTVQERLIWFIKEQRELIQAGHATTPYVVETTLVALDLDKGWAHFKTYIRDALGNEATMYGSEAAKDFPDYIEKASTKSVGRALVMLGYGTQFAPEISEGEENRPVDSPARQPPPRPAAPPAPARPTPTGNIALGMVRLDLHKMKYGSVERQNLLLNDMGLGVREFYTDTERLDIVAEAHKVMQRDKVAS